MYCISSCEVVAMLSSCSCSCSSCSCSCSSCSSSSFYSCSSSSSSSSMILPGSCSTIYKATEALEKRVNYQKELSSDVS